MPNTDLSAAEIVEIFGGEAGLIESNADEMEVNLAVRTIREQLVEAASEPKAMVRDDDPGRTGTRHDDRIAVCG